MPHPKLVMVLMDSGVADDGRNSEGARGKGASGEKRADFLPVNIYLSVTMDFDCLYGPVISAHLSSMGLELPDSASGMNLSGLLFP